MAEFPEIPGYKITEELGKGGMARVYLAIEEKLEREVAVKVLLRSLTEEGSLTARFLKEAKTAAGLRHTNIVSIFDVGKVGKETYYFVMEYLESNLKSKISKANIDPDYALEIISKVALALDYAHSKGFIHRDIKPDNIMFREDGTPVLVDFGIARAIGSNTKLTKTGMSIGTPHYMSPEQARGKPLDGRSDIYSLGVVLYEMLTGETPYGGEDSDSIAIAIKHIQEEIPELASSLQPSAISRYKNGELEKLQDIINRMMAKDPGDRPQSGKELIELINQKSGVRSQESEEERKFEARSTKSETNTNDQNSNYQNKTSSPLGDRGADGDISSEPSPGLSQRERGKKVLYLSLALIFLVIVTVWIGINSKNAEEKKAWESALYWDSKSSYESYISEYPSGKYISQAIANKERLENERIRKLKEENDAQLRSVRAKSAKAQRELERLRRAEASRQEEERLAAARKRREEERKRQSSYTQPTSTYSGSSYSSRVTLRSSYRKMSSSEVKSMLKRREFFDKFENETGNFRNDFRSKTISGDKVVVDRATGLMWHQSGSSSYINFSQAKDWIRSLNRRGYAGFSDWRLPSLEEGASLLESSKRKGVFIDPVFSSKQWWIWTGDKYDSSSGWVVFFRDGYVYWFYLTHYYYVRPVRRDR